MQRILEQINITKLAIGIVAGAVICASAGIGTAFLTRLVIICSCSAGIAFISFLLWDSWKKKGIEIYKQPIQPKPARPVVFNILENTGAIPENLLELAGINNMLQEQTAAEQNYLPPVLPAIRDSLVLVLLGSQGTGKTTLLCHLIDARSDGKALIIDPHGYPGKYNSHEITGAGRNYQECDEAMLFLMDEINRRYQDYYKRDYEKIYCYIDEATLLKKNCPSFQSFMEIMLTESRKVNIRLTLCLHSRRAKFLGLDGAMDLAEGIDWLNLKNENGQRWAELETDKENISLALPGPYYANTTQGKKGAPAWEPPRTPQEETIIYHADQPADINPDQPVNMTKIGYDHRPEMGTDKQQNIYDCLYYSDLPLRAVDISNQTGLKAGYVRVTLSRMTNTGVIFRNSNNTYEIKA